MHGPVHAWLRSDRDLACGNDSRCKSSCRGLRQHSLEQLGTLARQPLDLVECTVPFTPGSDLIVIWLVVTTHAASPPAAVCGNTRSSSSAHWRASRSISSNARSRSRLD